MADRYTFGDNARASARLRRLAEIYEPETRALLARGAVPGPELAVDLGWSTRLLREVVGPRRTVGLDSSARYVAEARQLQGPSLDFEVHDVTAAPFPVDAPGLLLCRFLLTHLRHPGDALALWAELAAPGARLLIHETESLCSGHPSLSRYYELVAALQRRHGQSLEVGALLEGLLASTPWKVVDSRAVRLEKTARAMASLHAENLVT